MFWERLLELCSEKKTNPSKVAADLNLSNATAVKWKKGSIPNGNTLELLANYFGVTTDYLLGRSDFKTNSDNDIKFALFNGAEGITDEMFEEVKQFAEMVRLREEAKKNKKEK